MFVSCVYFVASGLCEELVTRLDEFYRSKISFPLLQSSLRYEAIAESGAVKPRILKFIQLIESDHIQGSAALPPGKRALWQSLDGKLFGN